MSTSRPALFLDRDGVLNRHIVDGYVTAPSEFELIGVALEAARTAKAKGAVLVVVTNQGLIGRQLASESDILVIHALLLKGLTKQGVELDGIYACPHHPLSPDPSQRYCGCRKPEPGLILSAAADLNVDLTRSLLIGDQLSDAGAALAAGIARERILLVGAQGKTDPAEFVRSYM